MVSIYFKPSCIYTFQTFNVSFTFRNDLIEE